MVYQYSRAGLFWPSFGIQIPLAGTINICLKSFEIYEKLHFLKMKDETTSTPQLFSTYDHEKIFTSKKKKKFQKINNNKRKFIL